MNKGELKAQIASYTKRSDFTDSDLNGFVTLATARLGRDLRSSYNETYSDLAVSQNPAPLPADCRQLRGVDLKGDGGSIPLRSAGVQQIARIPANGGTARYYCVRARTLQLRPYTAGNYELNYFTDPAALVTDTDENAVLTAFPDLYLKACLIDAYEFIRDSAMRDSVEGAYDRDLRKTNTAEARLRAGATPAVGLG